MIAEPLGWVPTHQTLSLLMQVILALWLFSVGACVGSFLNVVIYRLPRGLNIVYPPSHCPRCGQNIRGYDNIPLISWLVLRGKCRRCRAPISFRYPLIEALTAVMFLSLAVVEVFSQGENLPSNAVGMQEGLSEGAMWGVYAVHLIVLCILLCSTAIAYDGLTMPSWTVAGICLCAAAVGTVLPLRPVAATPVASVETETHWTTSWGEGMTGGSVGALLGIAAFLLRWAWRSNDRRTSNAHRSVMLLAGAELALCGIVLGWQAAAVLASGGAGGFLLGALLMADRRDPVKLLWTLAITAGAIIYISGWRFLTDTFPQATTQADWPLLLAAGTAVLSVSAVARLFERNKPLYSPYLFETSLAFPANSKGKIAVNEQNPIDDWQPHAAEEISKRQQRILDSPSYRLAESDFEFLRRPELRPIRLQLELLKPEMALVEQDVRSTIVAFGGTQIVEREVAEKRLAAAQSALEAAREDTQLQRNVARAERVLAKAHYYDAAREFARLVSSMCQNQGKRDYVVITGGGPGVMEAANRGAFDVGAKSIGLNITLPHEQAPNSYITPELCFQFHYFALRKMHFLLRAKALIVFPGGFGTLDELFDALTLRQTQRMQAIPIILFGKRYWDQVINFSFLADEGVIADEHLDLIDYAETPQEAWEIIEKFHFGETG